MSARFDHELDPVIAKSLESLRVELPRDPQKAMLGRQEYLAQVKTLVNEKKDGKPVSRMPFFGLNGWIDSIRITWMKKEHRNMLATISTLIVIVTMVFGGSGLTALAAQNSLPSDFLYPVKIFGEEMHLAFSSNPERRMELRWRYSEVRIGEILDTLDEGQPLTEEWEMRWNDQFNLALQATAELDEAAMIRALERSRLRLRLQEQRLQALQANRPEDPGGDLERVRAQLRRQQGQVDNALDDPAAFRRQLGKRQQSGNQTPGGSMETPRPSDQGRGLGPANDTRTPVMDGTGPGLGPQSTPLCDNCTPAMDGTGPGPGPQHQGGDQPAQPPDDGSELGGSGEGGSEQGSSGTPSDSNRPDDSGNGNENGRTGEGNCSSCGSGGGPRHP